jgi:hypothetical protein
MQNSRRAGGHVPDLEDIVREPEWLPHRYQAADRSIIFLRLTKEDHRAATFLDDQYLQGKTGVRVPVDLLLAQAGAERAVHFIFHTAFCGSTLLARAFDQPGISFGLKEPRILIDLAVEARLGRLPPSLLQLVVRLLARPFAPGEVVVVKPGNEANNLMEALLDCSPASRALLLSSSLEDFLLSVAKKGMWGRIWVRGLFGALRETERRDPGFSAAELFKQTDLQIAAMCWLMHRSQFQDVARGREARLRSMDSAALDVDPVGVVRQAMTLFGVDASRADDEAIRSNFKQHSKELGRDFSSEQRSREKSALRQAHAQEIEMVTRWAEQVAHAMRIPLSLPAAPLIAG